MTNYFLNSGVLSLIGILFSTTVFANTIQLLPTKSISSGGSCPASTVCLVNHSRATDQSGAGQTTLTVTPTGVNASNGVLIGVFGCNDSACATTTNVAFTSVTATGTTCTKDTASETPTSTTVWHTAFFYCTPGASGTVTFTANFAGGGAFYPNIEFTEWVNANGVEGGNVATGNSTSLSATTAGSLSQASGEVVVSYAAAAHTLTPAQTAIGAGADGLAYQTTSGSPVTVTNTYTQATGTWDESIIAIKHL